MNNVAYKKNIRRIGVIAIIASTIAGIALDIGIGGLIVGGIGVALANALD